MVKADDTFVTFAYGSNMFSPRLRARVSSAIAIGIGELAGHSLTWDKSSSDGSGKCDAQSTGASTDSVWGVLFRIKSSEKPLLDDAEGLNHGYNEKTVQIRTGSGGAEAKLYYATRKDAKRRPYDWYKAFVLAGAREHGLPAEYILSLDSVASIPDPDDPRAEANARILSGR